MEGRLPIIHSDSKTDFHTKASSLSWIDSNNKRIKRFQEDLHAKIVTLRQEIADPSGSVLGQILGYLEKEILTDLYEFNLFEFNTYYNSLSNLNNIPIEKHNELKALLLELGYKAVYAALLDHILLNGFLKQQANTRNALSVTIDIDQETHTRTISHERRLEQIALLHRIRTYLRTPKDSANEEELNELVKNITHKSTLYLIIGVVLFISCLFLMLATHGIVIPYILPALKVSAALKDALTISAVVGKGMGGALIWWQQKPYSYNLHNFWVTAKKDSTSNGSSPLSISAHSPTFTKDS